jgi:hypothetical protein
MNEYQDNHLTADEREALLDGSLEQWRTFHLETCRDCRRATEADLRFLRAIAMLPQLEPSSRLTDRVMASIALTHPEFARNTAHLDSDEIDAWLDARLAQARVWHLEECESCLALADQERELVARLAALPLLSPAPHFIDRVVAAVPAAEAAGTLALVRRRLFASPGTTALAAGISLLLVGSMGSSIVWTLHNPDTIAAIGRWATHQCTAWAMAGARTILSTLIEQPWFGAVRRLTSSPRELALVGTLAMATYVSGLVALRRLIALPGSAAVRANS